MCTIDCSGIDAISFEGDNLEVNFSYLIIHLPSFHFDLCPEEFTGSRGLAWSDKFLPQCFRTSW